MEYIIAGAVLLGGLFIIGVVWNKMIVPFLNWLTNARWWRFFWEHVWIGLMVIIGVVIVIMVIGVIFTAITGR